MAASARLAAVHGHLTSSAKDTDTPTDLMLCHNPTAGPLSAHPLRVLITGAGGQIAYNLIHLIAGGDMLGPNQKVILHLLDIPPMKQKLDGVVMEIEDCAFPLIQSMLAFTDEREAFRNVDVALLVGAMPCKPGMERIDLLQSNAQIFQSMGKTINEVAPKNIKVVVVGNPANTNALITQTFAPSIPKGNFTALTRLDQNRGRAQVALKLHVPLTSVHNIIIWGNHSATQYPDLHHGKIINTGGQMTNTAAAINDDKWVHNTFIPAVQQRGAAVLTARGASSAMSAAKAIMDHVHDWLLGTAEGEIVSMVVASDGSYGIPEGLMFSFPVTCKAGGTYKIVQGLSISPFAREMLTKTTKELQEEKAMAGLA